MRALPIWSSPVGDGAKRTRGLLMGDLWQRRRAVAMAMRASPPLDAGLPAPPMSGARGTRPERQTSGRRPSAPVRAQQRLVRLRGDLALIAEAVDDRIAAVAAEILAGHLHAGRGLAALVFGEVEQPLDLLDGLEIVPAGDDLGDAHLALDEAAQDVVEHVVGRQRILVLLVLAQLRGRRLREDVLRDDDAVRPERARRASSGCAGPRGGRPPSCRGP